MPFGIQIDEADLSRLATDLEDAVKLEHDAALAATHQIALEAAQNIRIRVVADIQGAGQFGARWTENFRVNVDVTEGVVSVSSGFEPDIPYWEVFQYGATIHGNPWLWFKPKAGTVRTQQRGFSVSTSPAVIRVRQVTIPKKFHINEIVEDETAKAQARVIELAAGRA